MTYLIFADFYLKMLFIKLNIYCDSYIIFVHILNVIIINIVKMFPKFIS